MIFFEDLPARAPPDLTFAGAYIKAMDLILVGVIAWVGHSYAKAALRGFPPAAGPVRPASPLGVKFARRMIASVLAGMNHNISLYLLYVYLYWVLHLDPETSLFARGARVYLVTSLAWSLSMHWATSKCLDGGWAVSWALFLAGWVGLALLYATLEVSGAMDLVGFGGL